MPSISVKRGRPDFPNCKVWSIINILSKLYKYIVISIINRIVFITKWLKLVIANIDTDLHQFICFANYWIEHYVCSEFYYFLFSSMIFVWVCSIQLIYTTMANNLMFWFDSIFPWDHFPSFIYILISLLFFYLFLLFDLSYLISSVYILCIVLLSFIDL